MTTFEEYIRNFDYHSIPAMKMSSKKLIELLPSGTVQAIDIRFRMGTLPPRFPDMILKR